MKVEIREVSKELLAQNEKECTHAVVFITENDEERRIMGRLRHQFFFGSREEQTFPQYGGIRTELTEDGKDSYIKELKFVYKKL